MESEEESDLVNGEASESEDLLLSDTDEHDVPLNDDSVLKIDCNARLVTQQDLKGERDGDDCDTRFVDRSNFLGHRGSEAGHHTSTEDLNVSDDEKSQDVLTVQSVNLDKIASASAMKNPGSLSTLDYSHTVFKREYSIDAEFIPDDESRKDQNKTIPPGLTVAGLSSAVKTASSVILPKSHIPLDSLNIKNVFANSLLLDENIPDLQDDQESPPMTCLEFLKSELSDGNNTDAEDFSAGSLDEVEVSKRSRHLSGKHGNAPMLLSELSSGNALSGSRRSSVAEFNTEDETFPMERIPGYSQRVKKRNFRIVKKEEALDSDTEEEVV